MGWMTYLARSRGEVPPLPEPVRVEPVDDKGSLLLLTRERLTASNPEHVALGLRVQELLLAKDLLHPAISRPPAS
ncbi:MAG: Imm52 family immunity protein [Archangium sp.]